MMLLGFNMLKLVESRLKEDYFGFKLLGYVDGLKVSGVDLGVELEGLFVLTLCQLLVFVVETRDNLVF